MRGWRLGPLQVLAVGERPVASRAQEAALLPLHSLGTAAASAPLLGSCQGLRGRHEQPAGPSGKSSGVQRRGAEGQQVNNQWRENPRSWLVAWVWG